MINGRGILPIFPNAGQLEEVSAELGKIWALYGAGERFGLYLHGRGHTFPPEARKLAYTFLDRWLGL